MNYKEIKEVHIVFIALAFLIIVNIFMNDMKEGFPKHHNHAINHQRVNYVGNRYNYYNRYGWYDWNYWLYYVNPFYPPTQVDLPFEGKYGGTSWYEPWTGTIYNY